MRAASALFLEDGFERTSMDRIASAARVSKQAIYEAFRDKENLFDQVVRASMAPQGQPVLPTDCDPGDLDAMAEAFAGNIFDGFAEPGNYGLFRANIVATRRFPQLAADLHDYRRAGSRALASFLEQAMDEGRLPSLPGDAIDLATRLGGTTVEGSRYFLGYDVPPPAKRRAQAKLAAAVFLHGLADAPVGPELDDQPPFVPEVPELPGKAQMRMKPERFDALCRAAADEFLAHGFEGASLDPITAASGVGRATIYRQFGDKAGLFRHVIAREIAFGWQDLDPPAGASAEERLAGLCRTVLDLHLEPRSLGLHYLLVQEADLFPEIARAFYDMQVDRAGRPFARLLGEAGYTVPGPALLRLFHTYATFGVRFVVSPGTVDEDERAAVSLQAARIVLRGIAGHRG